MKTYDKADPDVSRLIDEIKIEHHKTLVEAGVTIQCVFATNCDKDGNPVPAVRVRGVSAPAIIKITSLEDRARGLADVKLTIDREAWAHANLFARKAIIDRELTRLMLAGEVDDLGRPKVSFRQFDIRSFAGFLSIADRYKGDSVELTSLQHLQEAFAEGGQMSLWPEGKAEFPTRTVDDFIQEAKELGQ